MKLIHPLRLSSPVSVTLVPTSTRSIQLLQASQVLQPSIRDVDSANVQQHKMIQSLQVSSPASVILVLSRNNEWSWGKSFNSTRPVSVTFSPSNSTASTVVNNSSPRHLSAGQTGPDGFDHSTAPPNFSNVAAIARCRVACCLFTAYQLHGMAQSVTNTSNVRRLVLEPSEFGLGGHSRQYSVWEAGSKSNDGLFCAVTHAKRTGIHSDVVLSLVPDAREVSSFPVIPLGLCGSALLRENPGVSIRLCS